MVLKIAKFKAMRLKTAAKLIGEDVDDTLSFYAFPYEHWLRTKTTNPLERIIPEISRRTRVVGNSPAATLPQPRRGQAPTHRWEEMSTKRYLNMKPFKEIEIDNLPTA